MAAAVYVKSLSCGLKIRFQLSSVGGGSYKEIGIHAAFATIVNIRTEITVHNHVLMAHGSDSGTFCSI